MCTLKFYATKRGDCFVPYRGSGKAGCNSIVLKDANRMYVCGDTSPLTSLESGDGETLKVNTNETLVEIDTGLFDLAAKERVLELLKKNKVVFSDQVECFLSSI